MTPSKRKGTSWEVAVRDYLHANDITAFRTAPTGARDEGDIVVPDWNAILECKNRKTMDLAGAVDEARLEAHHAGRRFGIAVVKRPRANVSKAYAVMALEDFVSLMLKP